MRFTFARHRKPVTPGEHTEHEDDDWTIELPDHPARTETPAFRQAKEAAHKIVAVASDPLVKALQETP